MSAAPASTGSEFDPRRSIARHTERVRFSFTCPVSLVLLGTAVTLFPCAHRINEEIAKEMFGDTLPNHMCVDQTRPCPVCRRLVIGYSPDNTFRQIVSEIFCLTGTRKLLLKLPESSIRIFCKEIAELPYPLSPTKFVLSKKSSNSLSCEKLVFRSIDPASKFHEFSLFVELGCTKIHIKFIDVDESLARKYVKYFESLQLGLDFFDFHFDLDNTASFSTDTILQTKRILKIIADNNEISDADYSLIKNLVKEAI
jgi:hypothetical protein